MKLLVLALPFLTRVSALTLPHTDSGWSQLRVGPLTSEHRTSPPHEWRLNSVWKTIAGAFGWTELDVFDVFEGVTKDDRPLKTIWEIISESKDFTKLTKLIKLDDEFRKKLDESHHLGWTFFAPDNRAFPSRPHHDDPDKDNILSSRENALAYLLQRVESLERSGGGDDDDHDDDDDKKHKWKIIKEIVREVLRYHLLPYELNYFHLGWNSSLATDLVTPEGSFDHQPQRVKLEKSLVPPSLTLNKYARIKRGDVWASNGVIHVIDHPLFPPFGVLDQAFLVPQYFSTLTSAIQKVGLEDAVNWWYEHDKDDDKDKDKIKVRRFGGDGDGDNDHKHHGHFVGTPSVTLFAPTNDAWKALPQKLVNYLFSPFGKRALTKLLRFHIIPDYIVYTEWVHDVRKKKDVLSLDDREGNGDGVSTKGTELDFEFPFPTALKGAKLDVHIVKTLPNLPLPGGASFDIFVQGHRVEDNDLPARNGVVHALGVVLDPRPKKDRQEKGDKDWDNWEEWLPRWAEE
ncbi:FAS1 domain-containing protein [Cantharellus anzutake]|uniref:FAS1 domain-containing protein n=1 Tax=Cantharellus anzutake TaxID=1750568 RepID=UPI00190513A3|nr:FAS1 domain-containing protein [Cantharellus anzutake]KAF8343968.1 FAS1 domain-containing protein [Cantharellus anzutake]